MPKPSLEERIASKLASENKGNSGSGSDTASTSAFSSGSGSGSGFATTTIPTTNASTTNAAATNNNIPKNLSKPSLEERIARKLSSEDKGNSGSGGYNDSASATATTAASTTNASTATAGATRNNIPEKLSKPSIEERIARKLSQEDSKPNSNNNKTGKNLTLTHEERIQRKLAGEDRQDTTTTATTAAAGTTPAAKGTIEDRIRNKLAGENNNNGSNKVTAVSAKGTIEDRIRNKLVGENNNNSTEATISKAATVTTAAAAAKSTSTAFALKSVEEEKEEIDEHARTITTTETTSTMDDRIRRKLEGNATNTAAAATAKPTNVHFSSSTKDQDQDQDDLTFSRVITNKVEQYSIPKVMKRTLSDRIKKKLSGDDNYNNATNNNPIKGEDEESSTPDDIIYASMKDDEKVNLSLPTQTRRASNITTVPSIIFDEVEGYHNNTSTATTGTTSTIVAPIDNMYTSQPMHSEPPLRSLSSSSSTRVNNYGVGNYGDQPNPTTTTTVNPSYTAIANGTDDYHDDGDGNDDGDNKIAGYVVQEALTFEGEVIKKERCNGLFSGYTKKQMVFGSIFIVLIMTLVIALSIIFGSGSSSGTQKTYAPTNVPTFQPTLFPSYAPSSDVYKDFASQTGLLPSNTSLLQTVGSPQYEALQWINSENKLSNFTSNDTMNNTTSTTNEIIIDPDNKEYIALIQRYVLAVFYHSTNGDDWTACSTGEKEKCSGNAGVPWLTGYHVCTWFGVTCNDDKLVTKLLLGTLCF